ncbi:hypothetical protein SAMN02745165_03468 [Malonomonas rubra DSM 5091]|uniref:Uncharacterized protein n=1 Tax=Malonomonas rubra DSM 5091 TaxID=1122189 RepID=A0A1M6N0D4_MALRU|nr:DUF444 family protein [Malonomonas rubra]SHJ89227.1 hypothetical protein SAMN02745165_03468 [Malonomonas rubra DSM 5091]
MKKSQREKYYQQLQKEGRLSEQDESVRAELEDDQLHLIAGAESDPDLPPLADLYSSNDYVMLHGMEPGLGPLHSSIRSIDDLLDRDKIREQDGFPRKIKIGKLVKPGRRNEEKVVVVPSTVEEKFIHDNRFLEQSEGGGGGGGHGDGEEGEVIGEQPVRQGGEGEGTGAGQGKGGSHDVDSNAYDLGRILTEKFHLPNLKEKGKKRSLTRYTYDLTDKNRGFGQVLDKKATLRQILETNIGLENLPKIDEIDPTKFLIAPKDKVYRILSREKDYESQAVVFFIRDYSGSMAGLATELVATQHILIYSWLLYQYAGQVETRFVLHDTEAIEADDFYTYYNSKVAGGTQVAAGYRLINKIVEEESLATDYNIYVFHGTDGDDWDREGRETIPELKKMLAYASRIGITIAEHKYATPGGTEVQMYIRRSGLLEQASDLLRLDNMREDSSEDRVIEGIRKLVSE